MLGLRSGAVLPSPIVVAKAERDREDPGRERDQNERKLVLHEHDALQREHRQRAADPAFKDDYRTHGPIVERSIAWLTRGNRRVPHRGIRGNNAWLRPPIAELKLRRLLALGLTVTEGSWALG